MRKPLFVSNEGSEHPVSAGASIGKHGDGMRQFLVERPCPIDVGNYQPPDGILPLIVWVDLHREPHPPPYEKCRERRYLIPLEEARATRAKIGLESASLEYTVCAHMGHLIE